MNYQTVATRLREGVNRARFAWQVRAMRDTPPLQRGTVPYICLSMVQHRDVLPYLLALKSLARFLPPARVVLVADPTLDADDRALLFRHVPHIEIREAAEFQREGIPMGGCWERLCAISQYAADSYVVQMDADTITLSEPTAVRQAVLNRVSFTLATDDNQVIQSSREIAAWARQRPRHGEHIQGLAETALDRFDPHGEYRYVRGCAGFAGFAPRSVSPEAVLEVSRRMYRILGDKWNTWGSEQVTSNILVCRDPNARVLPHPDYCEPTRMTPQTVFLHFMGFIRYRTSLYANLARSLVVDLKMRSS